MLALLKSLLENLDEAKPQELSGHVARASQRDIDGAVLIRWRRGLDSLLSLRAVLFCIQEASSNRSHVSVPWPEPMNSTSIAYTISWERLLKIQLPTKSLSNLRGGREGLWRRVGPKISKLGDLRLVRRGCTRLECEVKQFKKHHH